MSKEYHILDRLSGYAATAFFAGWEIYGVGSPADTFRIDVTQACALDAGKFICQLPCFSLAAFEGRQEESPLPPSGKTSPFTPELKR
ncbi:hypothetical protein AVMA1855_15120 [Acidovorax sp. SUPP1855]|uniref:hypothetical protein n=1 Tax=Acidovorax sp. SUPP1855 TaxID=431774 RepID=UPI0023DE5AF2|nr:hypothetical protein [Acidovorax sp. SUPP1855]GKS85498.1 hypothetical protein AVMA1855_15120 [Acidovorax sp. SUPP1855]